MASQLLLFNGADLSWLEIDQRKSRQMVLWLKNGILVNNPVQPDNGAHINYGNLRTEAEFEDFNLKLGSKYP
jgi:hypothetical protein